MKKSNTKAKIVDAAWNLFYEKGYEDTTIEDIIRLSGTSRGSFYHYFESKDTLLGSLAYLFDAKYEELESAIPPEQNAMETLLFLNRELFDMVEKRIDIQLLTRLYSTQLLSKGEKSLLDRGRVYYRLLHRIVQKGQERGELSREVPASEIVKLYALCERSLLYDWCLCGGEYGLKVYAEKTLPIFLSGILADNPKS